MRGQGPSGGSSSPPAAASTRPPPAGSRSVDRRRGCARSRDLLRLALARVPGCCRRSVIAAAAPRFLRVVSVVGLVGVVEAPADELDEDVLERWLGLAESKDVGAHSAERPNDPTEC